tara:strand:+ start:3885 stop:4862 length:978 start_codon:yes stop_codon:yes gene_type:complete
MNLVAYGTRPEWIKLQPLINILKDNHHDVRVLFTGQQKDIGEFQYDSTLKISNKSKNRLNDIISSILTDSHFDGVTHTIVQGDTASAFAVALSSFNRGIPVSHIEAGLRTHDMENPYPEESYRQMISAIASYHFAPTMTDFNNLVRERKNNIYITGNTVIDTLPELKVTEDKLVLVTMHRRENHEKMREWFKQIEKLANQYNDYEFILPLHPNPKVQEAADVLNKVNIVKPLEHTDLLYLLARSRMVITDSGGIQEEASFYGKKILVCRKHTERPSSNQMLVSEPNMLATSFNQMLKNDINKECPFGDGQSSQRIYSIMKEYNLL